MHPSLYKIEVYFPDGVCKNTYAFNLDDADRYISNARHFKEIGAVSAKLSVVYAHQGIQYQVLRKTVRF